jgi:FkbM family methyltransferase
MAWCRAPIEYIVDLGSNIGLSALLWSSLHPSARIVCVEPDEENFGLLQRNIEQLGDRCTAVRAAVADHDGTIDFFRSSSVYFWSSSTDPNIAKGAVQKVTVPAMTMGSILNHAGFPRIDLMKMDIEGGEKSVLPGMPAWPLRPKHLVAELHEPYHFSDFARDVGAGGVGGARAERAAEDGVGCDRSVKSVASPVYGHGESARQLGGGRSPAQSMSYIAASRGQRDRKPSMSFSSKGWPAGSEL